MSRFVLSTNGLPFPFKYDQIRGFFPCFAEVDVPTVVYGTKNGVTVMKDGSSESVISNGTVTYMAFDPRGRELYWSAGSECKAKLGGETQNRFDCHWSVQWVNISANATTVTQGLLLQGLLELE